MRAGDGGEGVRKGIKGREGLGNWRGGQGRGEDGCPSQLFLPLTGVLPVGLKHTGLTQGTTTNQACVPLLRGQPRMLLRLLWLHLAQNKRNSCDSARFCYAGPLDLQGSLDSVPPRVCRKLQGPLT